MIFYVVVEDFEKVRKFYEFGLVLGFKYIIFKVILKCYFVEINVIEYLMVLFGRDGRVFVDDGYFCFVVEIGNEMLRCLKGRFFCFEENFRRLREEFGMDEFFYEFVEEYKIRENWEFF